LNYCVTKLLTEGRDLPKIDEAYLYDTFTIMAITKFGGALNDNENLRPARMI
jgi:hypothetical protein